MISFNIATESSEDKVTYAIFGYIDEKAVFPKPQHQQKIFISLKDVIGINSIGTRSWCGWVKQMTPPSMVYLDYCPLLFVKSFNQIMGSLNSNMIVNSFMVPYCSSDANEQKSIIFHRGSEFDDSGCIHLPQVLDSKGEPMELDVLNQYFKFLKR